MGKVELLEMGKEQTRIGQRLHSGKPSPTLGRESLATRPGRVLLLTDISQRFNPNIDGLMKSFGLSFDAGARAMNACMRGVEFI